MELMVLHVPSQGWVFLELPGVELGLDRSKTVEKVGRKLQFLQVFLEIQVENGRVWGRALKEMDSPRCSPRFRGCPRVTYPSSLISGPFLPQEIAPGQLSLEDLLDMTDDQVCATVEKFGANSEECARLNASLSCLRSVHKSGG